MPKGKRFRQHQAARGVGIEGVDVHRGGVIDMLHHIAAGIGVSHLEADPHCGDDLSGFNVLLDDFHQRLKGGVIDKVAINLSVFLDEHVEGGHQRRTFLALGLDNGI